MSCPPTGSTDADEALISVTYLSSAVDPWSDAELEDLLVAARATNETRGVTGMLLHAGGNFIQTLEGSQEAVDGVMARVLDDPRHTGVLVVRREEVDERLFAGWSMGFRSASTEEASRIPGFTDYLRTGDIERASERRSAALTFHRVFRSHISDVRP
ncbi:BLUF domain-containing protein [Nocardioides oleivorans]|uniref:BLUF domain-containing protein n=1 Tax=Nocardioides oleivorans TaxID=273676 RepID=UPI0013EAE065|nr:BLUF domain-containing protein [Nocardioides oleivorans]